MDQLMDYHDHRPKDLSSLCVGGDKSKSVCLANFRTRHREREYDIWPYLLRVATTTKDLIMPIYDWVFKLYVLELLCLQTDQ